MNYAPGGLRARAAYRSPGPLGHQGSRTVAGRTGCRASASPTGTAGSMRSCTNSAGSSSPPIPADLCLTSHQDTKRSRAAEHRRSPGSVHACLSLTCAAGSCPAGCGAQGKSPRSRFHPGAWRSWSCASCRCASPLAATQSDESRGRAMTRSAMSARSRLPRAPSRRVFAVYVALPIPPTEIL